MSQEGTMVIINYCSFSINMAVSQPWRENVKLVNDIFGISICFFPYLFSICSGFIMHLWALKLLSDKGLQTRPYKLPPNVKTQSYVSHPVINSITSVPLCPPQCCSHAAWRINLSSRGGTCRVWSNHSNPIPLTLAYISGISQSE